ncbi:hypothetical protein JTB14_004536 [Gonioctena quinquepunctata]|nr:hypothetical protein JTB14_004536 [Gonioctena quinquepunctata]
MTAIWVMGHSDNGWMMGKSSFEYVRSMGRQNRYSVTLHFISEWSFIPSEFATVQILQRKNNNSHSTVTQLNSLSDISISRPLKNAWKNRIQWWRIVNNGEKLQREDVAGQLEISLLEVITDKNGFESCGLFPFDVNNVDFSKLLTQHRNKISSYTVPKSDIAIAVEDVLSSPTSKNFLKEIGKEYTYRL